MGTTIQRQFLLERLPKNSVGAEIGVHLGDFSEKILEIVKPNKLHLIDPWKHEVSATYENAWYGGVVKNGQEEMDARYANIYTKFKREIASKQIEVHRGYSDIVLAQFPDEYFDWVYIDGNHLYEYVKKDIELSFRKTKIGGYITGDDYIEGGWWKGGVKKAVDEYAKAIPEHLIEIRDRQFIFCNKF